MGKLHIKNQLVTWVSNPGEGLCQPHLTQLEAGNPQKVGSDPEKEKHSGPQSHLVCKLNISLFFLFPSVFVFHSVQMSERTWRFCLKFMSVTTG
jgi:hypothetical protein